MPLLATGVARMQGSSNCNVCDLSTAWYMYGFWDPASELFGDVNFKIYTEMVDNPSEAETLTFFFFRCFRFCCCAGGSENDIAEIPSLQSAMPKDPISELPQDRLSLSELYDSFCRDCGKVMCEILLPGQVSNTLALKLKETSPLNKGFFDLFCLEQLNQVLSNFFTTLWLMVL